MVETDIKLRMRSNYRSHGCKVRQRKTYTHPYNSLSRFMYTYFFVLTYAHYDNYVSSSAISLWISCNCSVIDITFAARKKHVVEKRVHVLNSWYDQPIYKWRRQVTISFISTLLSFLSFLSVNASFRIIVARYRFFFSLFFNARRAFHDCDFYPTEDYLWIVTADIRLIVRARKNALYAYRIRLLITRLTEMQMSPRAKPL